MGACRLVFTFELSHFHVKCRQFRPFRMHANQIKSFCKSGTCYIYIYGFSSCLVDIVYCIVHSKMGILLIFSDRKVERKFCDCYGCIKMFGDLPCPMCRLESKYMWEFPFSILSEITSTFHSKYESRQICWWRYKNSRKICTYTYHFAIPWVLPWAIPILES